MFNEYESLEGKKRYYIVELISYDDLCMEGKRFCYCVVIYVEDCMEGCCFIWLFRVNVGEEEEKLIVMIEVGIEGYIE